MEYSGVSEPLYTNTTYILSVPLHEVNILVEATFQLLCFCKSYQNHLTFPLFYFFLSDVQNGEELLFVSLFFTAGVFRCGPASVNAVKKGEVYLPYDTGFIFAEVNGDRVYWQVDDADGSMIAYNKETHSIGKYISTKVPGSDERLNVTGDYKYREGNCL